jgi:hypothetical protein
VVGWMLALEVEGGLYVRLSSTASVLFPHVVLC